MTSETEERDQPLTIEQKEEIRSAIFFQRLVKNHKNTMMFLCLFHLIIIAVVFANTFFNIVAVIEDNFFCYYAYSIKNVVYMCLNSGAVIIGLDSMRRSNNREQVLLGLKRARLILFFSMLLSPALIGLKFLPDFVCEKVSLDLKTCVLMAGHIFMENLFVLCYLGWFSRFIGKH